MSWQVSGLISFKELTGLGELGKNALFESCKIRERYQQYKHEEWDAKILGLAIDYIPLGEYLEEMQVETESVEDLL